MKYSWVNKRASYKVMVERGVAGSIRDPYTVEEVYVYIRRNEFPMSLLFLVTESHWPSCITVIMPKIQIYNNIFMWFLQYRDWWARRIPRWTVWQIWDAIQNRLYSFRLHRDENEECCSLRLKYVYIIYHNFYYVSISYIKF